MKIDRKIFESITKLDDFTESGHLDDLVDKKDIKENLLLDIPFAIFFNECVEHQFTYRECLEFIQLMVHHSCPKQEKMIPVWNRMEKMLAGKYEYNLIEENLIEVQSTDESHSEQFYVHLGLPIDSKLVQKFDELVEYSKELHCKKQSLDLEYDVARYFIETGVVECSAIQKHFGLGFNSAQKIIYELERKNILSMRQGNCKRSVLVDQETLDMIYRKSNKERSVSILKQEQQIYDMIPDDNMEILLKYNLLNDVVKAIRCTSLISLDRDDYADVLNFGTIFGYCKEVIPFGNIPQIIELEQPSNAVKIIISIDTGLTKYGVINDMVQFFRTKYPNADVVFGTSINNQLDGKMALFALLTSKK